MTDLQEKIVGCLRAWTEDTIAPAESKDDRTEDRHRPDPRGSGDRWEGGGRGISAEHLGAM